MLKSILILSVTLLAVHAESPKRATSEQNGQELATAKSISGVIPGRDPDSVIILVGNDRLILQVCERNLLKVDYEPEGHMSPETPCIGTTNWPDQKASINTASDPITIATGKMTVEVGKKTCEIAVYDAKKRLLFKVPNPELAHERKIHLNPSSNSHFYGLKGWEYLDDSRGQMEMTPSTNAYHIGAGCEGNTGAPLLWSTKGYGVFVDTDGGYCEIKSPSDVNFYQLSKANTEYYIMVGNPYEIQGLVADLTGKPPLFPKWALGFGNSEFTRMNEAICADNVKGYRSRGIPFDLYTFDFQWKAWGEDDYGEWHWNPTNFPNGPSGAFKQRMNAEGVKLAGIMKPRIHVDSVQGKYATDHNFWVPGRSSYKDYFSGKTVNDLDFSRAECRRWFWDHAEAAFDTGIAGWWNDEADAWGDNWEGMEMERALYEGQRAYTHDQQRVWSINRNFYSGAQRYAYATWSGDIDSGFKVMQQQRERLLCSLNVGQERWGMDTGGFNNNNRIKGDEYNECYARWMEFSAFVPVFRTHGCVHHQPWLFGPKAEAAATKAIRLRYSFVPYMYSYERNLNQTGVGLTRPLAWDCPDDPKCFNRIDAWMFGDYLLVAPVVDRAQSTKAIYLPAGSWIDYFRGTRFNGGQTLNYPVDSSTWSDIPLFVKEGAIIPSIEPMNYVGETPVTNVYVDVFPTPKQTTFSYYDDDGSTYDYENGGYFQQLMTAKKSRHAVLFDVSERTGSFNPSLQYYTCKIHCSGEASMTTVNGKPVARYGDFAELQKISGEGWAAGTDVYGKVIYVKIMAGRPKNVLISED
jgi:alpha-glucosidase